MLRVASRRWRSWMMIPPSGSHLRRARETWIRFEREAKAGGARDAAGAGRRPRARDAGARGGTESRGCAAQTGEWTARRDAAGARDDVFLFSKHLVELDHEVVLRGPGPSAARATGGVEARLDRAERTPRGRTGGTPPRSFARALRARASRLVVSGGRGCSMVLHEGPLAITTPWQEGRRPGASRAGRATRRAAV